MFVSHTCTSFLRAIISTLSVCFSLANVPMQPGFNKRVLNTVDYIIGRDIQMLPNGDTCLAPGYYSISGLSIVTYINLNDPTQKPTSYATSQFADDWFFYTSLLSNLKCLSVFISISGWLFMRLCFSTRSVQELPRLLRTEGRVDLYSHHIYRSYTGMCGTSS